MFIASTIEQRDGSDHSGEKTFADIACVTKSIGVSESEPWSETRKRVATVMGAEQQSLDGPEQPTEASQKKKGKLRSTEPMPRDLCLGPDI